MGLTGNFASRNSVIWIDVGNTGNKLNHAVVEKISESSGRQNYFGAQTYQLEIAPGVVLWTTSNRILRM
jgi:hypothetical protein